MRDHRADGHAVGAQPTEVETRARPTKSAPAAAGFWEGPWSAWDRWRPI